jgi:GGDEF domain-containing protein
LQQESLAKNTVDYNAAARLSYESHGMGEEFEVFLPKYLKETSVMVGNKFRERMRQREMDSIPTVEKGGEESKEEQLQQERLAKNAVDYNAAARLSYESLGMGEEFEVFLPKYLKETSVMVGNKFRDRMRQREMDLIPTVEKGGEESNEDEKRVQNKPEELAESLTITNMETSTDQLDPIDWAASVQLANQLAGLQDPMEDEVDEILKVELSELTPDEEELLGKAAREAVRKYEMEMEKKKSVTRAIQEVWEDDVKSQDLNEADDVVDYSQMTVAELKGMLKDRGLKVGGKKSDLVRRLMES